MLGLFLFLVIAVPASAGEICSADIVCPWGTKTNSYLSLEKCESTIKDQFARYAKALNGCTATPCKCVAEAETAPATVSATDPEEDQLYSELLSALEPVRSKAIELAETKKVKSLSQIKLDRIHVRPPARGSSDDDAYRQALEGSFKYTARWLMRATGGNGEGAVKFNTIRNTCATRDPKGLLRCYKQAAEAFTDS